MLYLALAGEPRFELCDFALGRDEVVHTDAALRHLRADLEARHGRLQLYNLRGSDVIARMLGWAGLPRVLEVTQVVPLRPGFDAWQHFGTNPTFRLYCDHFRLLPRDYEDGLSSTLVRQRIAVGGSPRFLVPDAVADYLREHRLYTS